jgi:hypothetical protein
MHIQHIKLETWEGYQPKEQLEEARNTPVREMAEAKLSKGEVEQKLSEETGKLESATEWQVKATRDEKYNMGDHIDLPICKEEVEHERLHEEES